MLINRRYMRVGCAYTNNTDFDAVFLMDTFPSQFPEYLLKFPLVTYFDLPKTPAIHSLFEFRALRPLIAYSGIGIYRSL